MKSPLADMNGPGGGMKSPLAGMSGPGAGMKSPLAGMSGPGAGMRSPLAGMNGPGAGMKSPLAGICTSGARVRRHVGGERTRGAGPAALKIVATRGDPDGLRCLAAKLQFQKTQDAICRLGHGRRNLGRQPRAVAFGSPDRDGDDPDAGTRPIR